MKTLNILINRDNLKFTDGFYNYEVLSERFGNYDILRTFEVDTDDVYEVDEEHEAFTRDELKKMVTKRELELIDETLELVKMMECEKDYTEDGLNFIDDYELNQIKEDGFCIDDFKLVIWEVL